MALATDYGVGLYDARTHRLARTLEHPSDVLRMVFSLDGELLATESGDKVIRRWRVRDGTLASAVALEGYLRSDVFGPEGEFAVYVTEPAPMLRDAATGGVLQRITAPLGESAGVRAFSPSGQFMVSVDGEAISLWRVRDDALIWTVNERDWAIVTAVAFHPQGEFVATGSYGGAVRLWRASDGTLVRRLRVSHWSIYDLEFSPDGRLLAANSLSYAPLTVWHVHSDERALFFPDADVPMAFSPDSRVLAFNRLDQVVEFHQIADGARLGRIGGSEWVDSVAVDPAGRLVAVGRARAVELRRLRDGHLLCTIVAHRGLLDVAFSPDGRFLATVGYDEYVRLWQVADGTLYRQWFADDLGGVLAFSADGRLLAVASDEKSVRVWSVADGRLAHHLEGAPDYLAGVAFSPDGTLLAASSTKVRVWRLADGTAVRDFASGVPGDVVFSPDGGSLVASAQQRVTLWRLASGEQLYSVEGHDDVVQQVAFSPDGRLLFTGSADQTVRAWNAADGRLVSTFADHRKGPSVDLDFAVDPAGRFIVSGSGDGTVGVWGVPPGN